MFFEFDDSIINSNAVSEIKIMNIDGYHKVHKVMVFRMDGSWMASESYTSELEAERRFSEIYVEITDNH